VEFSTALRATLSDETRSGGIAFPGCSPKPC
jgi:hypothetical protein